jgi:transposase InsO family protein
MEAMEEAITAGLSVPAACATVGVSERRYWYWRAQAAEGSFDRRPKPAHVRPVNALTPREREVIAEAVGSAEWADASCRELSVRIMEQEGMYVSPHAIWVYERDHGLAGHRGKRRRMGVRRPAAPQTGELTGPNQLWAWDITKLRTGVSYRFWYLYVVLDQWSRKVVGWHVSDREVSAEAQRAWDQALLGEGLSAGMMPRSLSDRGAQMRSHTTTEFFRVLGIAQLFARPRTPNDNPYIESLFATVKTAPAFPDAFPTIEDAIAYFKGFFAWYNGEHLHTRIGMVTPNQRHSGEWVRILAERARIREKTLAARRQFNQRAAIHNITPGSAIS